jgi:23S rRNA (uridine2552-2'-O)-methyltransferase
MARSKSSAQWLRRHVADPYVKRAVAQGYRSRSAYKLLEIDRKEHLLRRGTTVVDLGAAPGGWSQVAAQKVMPGGTAIAVDLLPIAAIPGVQVLAGDFLDARVQADLVVALGGKKADLVLCDLSPNLSGIASTDQARAAELARTAIDFSVAHLKPTGTLLLKVFHGEEFDAVRGALKETFREVRVLKPAASRGESRETYLIGRGLRT